MSQSPKSQHRASLIRQMAKDLNRTRGGATLSRGSSRASNIRNDSIDLSFDPENEALASTRQIHDFPLHLPEPKASVMKQKYPAPPEADVQIDTSALHRAFPDFSQGPISFEDDSQSIEIGRAAPLGPAAATEFSSMVFGDSLDMSPAAYHSKGKAVNTSPKLPALKSRRDISMFQKKEVDSHHTARQHKNLHTATKASDHGSNGSRQSSGENRRTLADLHARAVNEESATQLSDDRPSTINLTSRSSRFVNGGPSAPIPPNTFPSVFSSAKDLLQTLNGPRSSKGRTMQAQPLNATVSSIHQGTQQSFMLPDMPNISELVSGVFEDGTPVFTARTKDSHSRFSGQPGRKFGLNHVPISSIPIPEDEQAIYVSLKLLQEKVDALENSNAEAGATIQTLKARNNVLEREKADRRRLRRTDSALGITSGSDAGDEFNVESRKSHIERLRLESSLRQLQEQLSSSTNQISQSATIIKQLTHERDSAITQLGIAYVTTEQLKVENKNLAEENDILKGEVDRVDGAKSDCAWPDSHVTFENSQRGISQGTSNREKANDEQDFTQILDVNTNRQARAMSHASHADGTLASRLEETAKTSQKKPKTRLVLEEYSESEVTEDDARTATSVERNLPSGARIAEFRSGRVGVVGDVSCLSTKSDFFTGLRNSLEEDRKARKARVQGFEATQTGNGVPTVPLTRAPLPRKSSLKSKIDRTGGNQKSYVFTEEKTDITSQSRASSSQQRRQSDHSLLEQRSRQGGAKMEDMTSAFIIPDITIHNTDHGPVPGDRKFLSQVDILTHHNTQNCTICQRILEHGKPHSHTSSGPKVTISKPVPVSTRAPSPTPSNPDPTLRPSQSPGLALASVIKSISEEIAHLKAQLAKQHVLYNQHDPALSKRKRQTVCQNMEKLMRTINARSEQVYSLYDVLEGQQRSGQEMSEHEVEMTLESVGIDPTTVNLSLRGGGPISTGVGNTASAGEDVDIDMVADVSSMDGSDSVESTEELAVPLSKARKERGPIKAVFKHDGKGADESDGSKRQSAGKHIWDIDNDATDSLPWEGCDSTRDLTGKSRGSDDGRRKSWGV